jgi:hypothetical protein
MLSPFTEISSGCNLRRHVNGSRGDTNARIADTTPRLLNHGPRQSETGRIGVIVEGVPTFALPLQTGTTRANYPCAAEARMPLLATFALGRD